VFNRLFGERPAGETPDPYTVRGVPTP
jgi:hypothetical protein